MAYNFNNGDAPPVPSESEASGTEAPTDGAGTQMEPPPSEAVLRFRACRWMQPVEDGNPAFCTHREVKPYAGSSTFDAGAWCPDCTHYKLRRVPKKRSPDDFQY